MNTEKKRKKAAYDIEYMKKNYDRIAIQVRKGTRERWRNAAQIENKSLNRFVIDIVERYIDGKNDE